MLASELTPDLSITDPSNMERYMFDKLRPSHTGYRGGDGFCPEP